MVPIATRAQIASFNFSATAVPVTGWTNVYGNPAGSGGPITATAGGITVSSVNATNWSPNSSSSSAYNNGGAASGTYFPAGVMADSWIQYNGTGNNQALYNALVPQLAVSGLNPDSTYILRMSGSNVYYNNPTLYTVAGRTVSGSQSLNTYENTNQGVTFEGVTPDSTGKIRVFVNCPGGLSGTNFAWISGLQVFSGSANVGTPQVAIALPANGAIVSEGANVIINATATETGGTIAKVEFYEDTSKIGEVDAPPYNFTWVGPEPGLYTVTAKATDNVGTISTAAVNIGVQSLNYFWSTTGNIATNGDSNFIGTVDTNRLSFRTNDVERMSISRTGTVMVGTANAEDSLSLHGTLTLIDTSHNQAPMNLYCNNIYSPFVNLSNTSPAAGASIGIRYWNDSGLVAQFFSGSSHDAYTPYGYAFHQIGRGGMEFVAAQPTSYFSWGNNFKTSGGAEMIFYPHTGHLIIGSTTDSGNNILQINGNTWTTGLTIPTRATAGYVLTSDSSGNGTWQPGSGGHWIYANGTVYDSVDNIAIGTSNPQGYKFAVNGTAIFTKVKVKTAGTWPDYVFAKGYHLPDLEWLEDYLAKYRHLPDIASEAEVKKDGIDVGDHAAALLKKVEELTLYLIEENKALKEQNAKQQDQATQMKTQQDRLDQQQKEIDELKRLIAEKK
jgi:hypothetical protein